MLTIMILKILYIYRQLDSAGKAEESGVFRGTACTDAVAFKGRMGNSKMQIGPILIAPVSLLETLFKSTKRKEQLKPL